MPSNLQLPADFAKKIAELLNWQLPGVQETFEISEDKEGYFLAKLRPKKFLDKPDFVALCKLVKSLNGEDYLQGARGWKVPGPLAKKGAEKPSGQGTHSEPAYKEPGKVIPPTPRIDHTSPYTLLPLNALYSMPFQSRTTLEGPDFEDLVASIKTFGILEPLLVREKANGLFEIVAGERRAAAAKKAGLLEVPATIRTLTDQEAYEIQLVENIQRKDLSDMEKARMLDMMITKFGYLQKDLAKKLGKSEAWVSQYRAMLHPESILHPGEVCSGEPAQSGNLTERQARELSATTPEQREEILDEANVTGKFPSARRIEEIRKSVACAGCGEPIAGTPVYLGDGKYYDAECAEQVVEEAKKGLIPEDHVGSFQEEHAPEPETPKGKSEPPKEPEPVDVAVFTCKICGEEYRISHVQPGVHELELVNK